MNLLSFYNGKNVLLTGHTGFKGSWMTDILVKAGASVTGYSLENKEKENLFEMSSLRDEINHVYGDIRDLDFLLTVFKKTQPEIVFHLAAQPLVRLSYSAPVETYTTNVIGTVNVCEAIRKTNSVRSFVNVTTDKVYDNKEWVWGYREIDSLDGYDPYSNSKSCSELVTNSYRRSFLEKAGVSVSTIRAGNVIGGGDFSEDRIIPDCIRAILGNKAIIVRNPLSVRPYQGVLDVIFAYLMVAAAQYEESGLSGSYNVGPEESGYITTGKLVDLFIDCWGDKDLKRVDRCKDDFHEANCLNLDCSKIKRFFGWEPRWNIRQSVEKVVEWNKAWISGADIRAVMEKQINEYLTK